MLSVGSKKLKILVVGDFVSPVHEAAVCGAFSALGNVVYKFSTTGFFRGFLSRRPGKITEIFKFLYYRLQNKFSIGPAIFILNNQLLEQVGEVRPDLIFIYRGTHIYPSSVQAAKKYGALVFGYNNDDPFGANHPAYMWRHFKEAIPKYDHIFVYREKNLEDYKNIGYANTSLLRSYYIKERNYPLQDLRRSAYSCDVTFIGHYEDDGREEYIKAIVEEGIDFQLHGPEWERSKYYTLFKGRLGLIESLKDDYNLALNSARIALVFLSKLNNDTYTRRCFEIPAAGTFMLAEYSKDLAEMFAPGIEADYFTNKAELLTKIKHYLGHEEERKRIAAAGHERLMRDGHEVLDRAREILAVYDRYKNTNENTPHHT